MSTSKSPAPDLDRAALLAAKPASGAAAPDATRGPKLAQSAQDAPPAHAPPTQPSARATGGGSVEAVALDGLRLSVGFDTAVAGLHLDGVQVAALRLTVDDPHARGRLSQLLHAMALALARDAP